MSMNDRSFFADLEWEGLQSPITLTSLEKAEALPPGIETATVQRDESYRLQCGVHGTAEGPFGAFDFWREHSVEPFTLIGHTLGYSARLLNSHVIGMNSEMKRMTHNSLVLRILTDRLIQESVGIKERNAHIDWFLNGPSDGVIFERDVIRQTSLEYSRTIKDAPEYERKRNGTLPWLYRDCALVKLPGFHYLLRSVPKEYGPKWSRQVAIEYSSKLTAIPPEESREGIAEIVSFVLGRQLIDVGDTTLGEKDWPAEMRSWNPRGINVPRLCSQISFPPIPIDRLQHEKISQLENLLQTLTPRYLALRNLLCLDHALWRYWVFQEMYVGINLPMIVNALEILAKAWFQSPFSASKGRFLSETKFKELFAEELTNIRAKLQKAAAENVAHENAVPKLMRRVEDSFRMGPNSKNRQFFAELGLSLSEEEADAMEARHTQIHSYANETESGDLWRKGEILRTLFYKVVLRLLDYSGPFLDYGTQVPTMRNLTPGSQHNGNYHSFLSQNLS